MRRAGGDGVRRRGARIRPLCCYPYSLYKYLQECAILRTKDFEAIKLCLFEIGDIYRNFRS